MDVSPIVEALIEVFEAPKTSSREGRHLTVSRTVSTLAVLYEKARNAVEFRAEHLVRRAATERILKRRLMLKGDAATVAENLIVELLWARYIDSSLVDDEKVAEIQKIIDKYFALKGELFSASGRTDGISWDTVLGIASSEIDEAIVSASKREGLINFFYQAIRPKITLPNRDKQYVNMLTYIAVERAYAQSDNALITFHLLRMMQPGWVSLEHGAQAEIPEFVKTVQSVLRGLRDPVGDSVYRYVRTKTAPFLLIRDFFLDSQDKVRAIINNRELFENKLTELANKRYQETGTKVRRAVIRSIIYIFLTKMLFALALEAPFDMFISKKITYIPLAINSLFPPILLFLVAGFLAVPGQDNTRRLIDRIFKIIYDFDSLSRETDVFEYKQRSRRPILTAIFGIFYLATFVITFGLISWILTRLHFNIASQIIFIFFVTLVSFFAYRIRASAKEYEIVERQGFLEPLVDFFFLPILRAGHWLSREIARLNIFIFLFDFILEAPLKVIFEVVEEWIQFIRTKKEEII